MSRTPRTALAAVALLALPQFAAAGPIQWGYRAEAPDGALLGSATGLTATTYSASFMPVPDLTAPPSSYTYLSYRIDVWQSHATVLLTDETSGQSASFAFARDYLREYKIAPGGTESLMFEGGDGGPAPTVLALGDNTYRVYSSEGAFLVNVTNGPITTPEPGTLALSGLGLCGLGAWRRLRR